MELAGFWPRERWFWLGEVVFGPPKISYGFQIAKNPTWVSAAFPKALGLWADLGGRCSAMPSLQNSWKSIPRAGGEAAAGKSCLKNQQILLLPCPVGGWEEQRLGWVSQSWASMLCWAELGHIPGMAGSCPISLCPCQAQPFWGDVLLLIPG